MLKAVERSRVHQDDSVWDILSLTRVNTVQQQVVRESFISIYIWETKLMYISEQN